MKNYYAFLAATSAALALVAGEAWGASQVNPPQPAPAVGAPGAPASFADIVARVAPAVVSIDVDLHPEATPAALTGPGGGSQAIPAPFGAIPDLRQFFQQQGVPAHPEPEKASGSGFFISPDGYIVTNNHVIDHADKITVRLNDGRSLTAHLVGADPDTDLAVLKVEGKDFAYVNFADHGSPRVGDWVVAVGNPFNLGGTATAGIVSALVRPRVSGSSYVDYMQIDAPINRGNSGGPTFDINGRVVGVNSAIFSPSGGSVGIGFDIPAPVAARVTRQLIADGKVVRGYIGATVQDVTPDIAASLGLKAAKGALVAEVTDGGPSDKSGVKPGDLILKMNGQQVDSATDLTRKVASVRPGDAIHLMLRRSGADEDVIVTSGSRPTEIAQLDGGEAPGAAPEAARGGLGLAVGPDPSGGVRVEGVAPDSDAAQKGVQPGDVIQRVGSESVHAPADVAHAVATARAEGRKSVLLLISRNGRSTYVPVDLAAAKG